MQRDRVEKRRDENTIYTIQYFFNMESNLGNTSHVSDKLQLVERDSNFSGGEENQIYSYLVQNIFCPNVFGFVCLGFFGMHFHF